MTLHYVFPFITVRAHTPPGRTGGGGDGFSKIIERHPLSLTIRAEVEVERKENELKG